SSVRSIALAMGSGIDHVKGDSFAYIQYESLDAAQAACAKMRCFPLGGPDRRLRVDFAKSLE
ncbi:RNA-binding protein, partial [Serratia marcescens]|uniref:RNA-binding protein n=1 Tax=Serratia marcescens TaxID=615 RepID=UPI0019536A9F